MIFKLGSVLLSPAPMEVDLQLDQKEPVYTHRDTVSGRVILCNESAADLSTVVLKLSGTAISRFNHSSRTETHHIFKKSQQIFPPELLMKESKGSSVTLGGGILTLPFSITFPQATECYKTDHWSSKTQFTCANIGRWRAQKEHLLRKCPPSTGDSRSPAEISYSLSVIVTGKGVLKKTRNILFHSLSDPLPQQKPLKKECDISISPHIIGAGSPLSFRIDTELLNGPCLLLGKSVPLVISVTKLGNWHCPIVLNEFQTMLVERTQVKAQGVTESSISTWIVQSTANMNYPIGLAESEMDSVAKLRESMYSRYLLPPGLTPSFEVCNIKRTYRLNVRLGFLVGSYKIQTIIREIEFPVYIMGPNLLNWIQSS